MGYRCLDQIDEFCSTACSVVLGRADQRFKLMALGAFRRKNHDGGLPVFVLMHLVARDGAPGSPKQRHCRPELALQPVSPLQKDENRARILQLDAINMIAGDSEISKQG